MQTFGKERADEKAEADGANGIQEEKNEYYRRSRVTDNTAVFSDINIIQNGHHADGDEEKKEILNEPREPVQPVR